MAKLIIQNMGSSLGDCFFIEIEKHGIKCVIMVDGHRVKEGYTEETQKQMDKYERIDYLIVTHIDGDHIKGVRKFWEDKRFRSKFEYTVIIYNFVTQRKVNYKDAYAFEKLIDGHYVIPTGRYDYINFSNELLKIISLEKRTKFDINDTYAYLTLIAPDRKGIQAVYEDYCDRFRKAGNEIKKISQPENNITNHNSIVFLLEFVGTKLLFMGDNDIDKIEPLIDKLKNMNKAKIDLIKIGHHGAWEENKRLVKFIEKYNCNKLIVTGEKEWTQKHPDKRILEALDVFDKEMRLYTKIKFDEDAFEHIKVNNSQEIEVLIKEDYES